jgi:hypothetical protein
MNNASFDTRTRKGGIACRALARITALSLMLAGAAAFAQGCPNGFMDKLESRTETTAAKQTIAESCRGKAVRIRGTVTDVAKRGNAYEVRITSAASGYPMTVMMSDPPGADLSQLKMGTAVTIDAKMRDLYASPTDYFNFEEGRCVDCGR